MEQVARLSGLGMASQRFQPPGAWGRQIRWLQGATPMSSETASSRAERAARNNAIWCDTVCRAHGLPGELGESIWLNRHATPHFYPNAVTTAPDAPAQLAHVRELLAAAIPGG